MAIRQIQKQHFLSFKKVRDLENNLYGPYQLYSKNGHKYIGKYLPKDAAFISFRNPVYPIIKYNAKDQTIYLFPMYGQPIDNFISKTCNNSSEGQIKQWVDKTGSIQNCLWDIAKLLIRLVQEKGLKQIICDCLRVHNGVLQYCYDSWMKPSHAIVLQNLNQLQNYYFSPEELQQFKTIVSDPIKYSSKVDFNPSKRSLYFKIFMLILQLGTCSLNHRNYEYNLYELNIQHISLKLDYFCARYNAKGLGDLTRNVIEEHSYSMEHIWKVVMPEIEERKSTKSKSGVSSYRTIKSVKSFKRNKQNQQHIHPAQKLNTSFASEISLKDIEDDSRISLQKKDFNRRQSKGNTKVIQIKKNKANLQKSTKCKTQACPMPKEKQRIAEKDKMKAYTLFSSKNQLDLRQILQQSPQIPSNCIKLLKYLNLQEYIPTNRYQQTILTVLENVHIKSIWRKQFYENGSIYLGELKDNKKEGKGMYLFGSNDFYYGDWSQNVMNGYGTYVFANGEVYEGQISKGAKEGHGKCIYQDGREYEGSWIKNCKVGLGKIKFPNDVTFIGVFKPSSSQTEGLFIGPMGPDNLPLWQNKGILENYNWQANTIIDNRSPQETIFQKRKKLKICQSQFYSERQQNDGSNYQGQLIDGKKHGFGICQSQQELYQGEWFEDKRQGFGILHVKNGFSIAGRWQDNFMVEYAVQDDE